MHSNEDDHRLKLIGMKPNETDLARRPRHASASRKCIHGKIYGNGVKRVSKEKVGVLRDWVARGVFR
jgi:hypothetical protein